MQSKFNFIPAKQLRAPSSKILVSYNKQTHFLSFIRQGNPEVGGLIGKYVKLYADTEKKALAWTYAPSEFTKPEHLADFTQIKEHVVGEFRTIRLYVPKPIVDALRLNENKKRMEVKSYKSTAYTDNNTYYYIEF